jgi:four helix bundle protein
MATVTRFEDLQCWQKARELTRVIYRLTKGRTFYRDFKLRDQIRDAAVSAMSNIAEGFERDGSGEFKQFLSIAKGSAGEVRSQLYVALDAEHITEAEFREVMQVAVEVSRMIWGLMGYLSRTELRGTKFRKD